MIFTPTPLKDAMVVDLEVSSDVRGGFSRTFCAREFESHGMVAKVAQCNMSFNFKKGTVRGMHYQKAPALESKLIRCVRGAIQDVVNDLRTDSPTYMKHFSIVLSQDNRTALYVPGMFAHGYLTLTEDTEVIYNVGEFYTPGLENGIRYDDPAFGIEWMLPVSVVSEKDASWPPYLH
jgi:dTDP-4-dehydrorhamnose 3,5-epimerase